MERISILLPIFGLSEPWLTRLSHHQIRTAELERVLQSIFEQDTLVPFEILIVHNDSRFQWIEHLETVFAEEISKGRLSIFNGSAPPAMGKALNAALEKAQGAWIGLTSPQHVWGPTLLTRITSEMKHTDLILAASQSLQEPSPTNLVAHFLRENPAVQDFGFIRRHLLESIGGFPEGLMGAQDYQLWLRALLNLQDHGRLDHAVLIRVPEIQNYRDPELPIQKLNRWFGLFHVSQHIPNSQRSAITQHFARAIVNQGLQSAKQWWSRIRSRTLE